MKYFSRLLHKQYKNYISAQYCKIMQNNYVSVKYFEILHNIYNNIP